MNVFFGVPYSNKIDEKRNVFPKYREELEIILDTARQLGHTAFCAPEHDGWQMNHVSPAEAYILDTKKLEEADVFIGILESEKLSTGVCMEALGAAIQGKPILIISDKKDPEYMIAGLTASVANAEQIVCTSQEQRLSAIRSFLTSITI